MAYYGSWKIDDALTFACNTHTVTTGAATDADSVPSYRVYEDETGTAILSGSMAKLDDANTTGFYSEQITLSAANGFEKGKAYTIYISATVNSVTGTMHHSFQLEAEVDSNRINWANVDNPTTTLNLSGTTVKDATDVNSDTDTLLSRIGTPSNLGGGATLSGNLSDIEAQTDDIGTAGAGLTAVPWNAAWDAEVQSEVDDALVAHRLDELLNADSDIDGAAPPTVGSVFHELMSKTAGSFTFDQTTDSNEAIRDNMGTAQTGDAFARLGAPAGASVSADIADLPTNAELTTALGTADDAVLAAIAALNNLSQANIRTAVGLGSANLDTQLSAIDDLVDDLETRLTAARAGYLDKLNSLTFTVAGQVDANIQSINDTTIVGNGASPKFGV